MKIEMEGYIESAGMKVGASSDLVKKLSLEVQGDLSSLEGLMKQPLRITFETLQASFGEPEPERKSRQKKGARNG